MLDPKTYQKMVDELYLADSARRIEQSIDRIEDDKGIEAKKVFKNLRKKINKANFKK